MSYLCVLTIIISFAVSAISGKYVIKWLQKLNCGQTIYEEGPAWHKSKNGTPTMGGIMFILGTVVAATAGFVIFGIKHSTDGDFVPAVAGVIASLLFSAVGFVDDYIKVVKKRNLGLTAIQKLIAQFLIAIGFVFSLYGYIDVSEIWIPFIGNVSLGWLYYVLAVPVLVFVVNAVNLTDGIDGLASTVTIVSMIGYIVVSSLLGYIVSASVASAVAGGCMGFLIYNHHPAKVFMGDTGSMFLGGMVAVLSFTIGTPTLILLMGALYILEALSVCLQVISFKLTGKRIFLMSPVHHHFEKKGYSENQIVRMFSAVEFIFIVIAIISVLLK